MLPATFLYDLTMIMPPLNQTLWMLLVASLTALAGWAAYTCWGLLIGNPTRNRSRRGDWMFPHAHVQGPTLNRYPLQLASPQRTRAALTRFGSKWRLLSFLLLDGHATEAASGLQARLSPGRYAGSPAAGVLSLPAARNR